MFVGQSTSMGPAAVLCYGLVALYRVTLAAVLGGHCRFHPSCSVYAQDALQTLPFGRALGHILRRLGRCHPWHPGGYDPVLPREKRHE